MNLAASLPFTLTNEGEEVLVVLVKEKGDFYEAGYFDQDGHFRIGNLQTMMNNGWRYKQ